MKVFTPKKHQIITSNQTLHIIILSAIVLFQIPLFIYPKAGGTSQEQKAKFAHNGIIAHQSLITPPAADPEPNWQIEQKIQPPNQSTLAAPKSASEYQEFHTYALKIDGNTTNDWAWAAQTFSFVAGNGSVTNPYLIRNVEFDAGGSGTAVTIQNCHNIFFIIDNCSFINTGSGIQNNDSAIALVNVTYDSIYSPKMVLYQIP